MSKRKRENGASNPRKTHKLDPSFTQPKSLNHLRQPVLEARYTKVDTLSDFLLSRLPSASRIRRRRILSFDADHPKYASFLHSTVVGTLQKPSVETQNSRRQDLIQYTQTQRSKSGSSGEVKKCNVKEVVAFAVWRLFQTNNTLSKHPDHLICYGYQRSASVKDSNRRDRDLNLPGIVSQHPNSSVIALTTSPWTEILGLLGEDGETIFSSLLLDCGVFIRIETGEDNFYQLSGIPLFHLASQDAPITSDSQQINAGKRTGSTKLPTTPSKILFVRNRMFYARPSINGAGNVRFGLKHIHVFNRYNRLDEESHDVHVLRYMFPRQFGLHNVFTSSVNPNETTQSLKDYTIREDEIAMLTTRQSNRVPRRLRNDALDLVKRIRRMHHTCSYTQLLRYYCPNRDTRTELATVRTTHAISGEMSRFITQKSVSLATDIDVDGSAEFPCSGSSVLPYATDISCVSAFCRAVLQNVLPRSSFGEGLDGDHNWIHILGTVNRFIKMRRFETMSVHEATQHIRVNSIRWLQLHKTKRGARMSASDKSKRLELLNEFIYFVFDSILVPLIRSNFYVTETGVYRNRLLYFRHDVWRKLSEPSLMTLRMSTFRALNSRQLRRAMELNRLGYSQIRMLPKEHGARPITNLKRRIIKIVNGKRILGSSINKQLAPVFNVLKLERQRKPSILGSAIFSVGDIRGKLKDFKAVLGPLGKKRLFFVKVDIRSCFDTIPQDNLLNLVNDLLAEKEYRTGVYVETKRLSSADGKPESQLFSRFVGRAHPGDDSPMFGYGTACQVATNKRQTFFVSTSQERTWRLQQIQKLLRDHIQNNVVRIGRKHFRQVQGIPQGSVLSSLLCSFFYAEFERQHLDFIRPRTSLLLRLIDDFLLITTDAIQATGFIEAMSSGHDDYGILINAGKSLANFEASADGRKLPRVYGSSWFPYCGVSIDMRTLELSKGRERKDVFVGNALTVDIHGRGGTAFQRRIASALRIQMHAMLLDCTLNSRSQIVTTIFESFVETAMKMHQYRNNMPQRKRPGAKLVFAVCRQLVSMASRMVQRAQDQGVTSVDKPQICWLAATAMIQVLQRKQSDYKKVLLRLSKLQRSTQSSMNSSNRQLDAMARTALMRFKDCIY